MATLLVFAACSSPDGPACGPHEEKGLKVTTFCGEAAATVVVDSKTHKFSKGVCKVDADTVVFNAGTVVQSEGKQSGHDYLAVQIGVAQRLPAASDGTYEAVAVAFVVDGATYAVVPSPDGKSRPSATLFGGRRKATFKGTAIRTSGGKSAAVTGSITCPGA